MKTKKFEKKLWLNKKTIAHLGNIQLGNVKGGDLKTTLFPCQVSECEPCQTLHFTNCDTLPCASVCHTQCGPGGETC